LVKCPQAVYKASCKQTCRHVITDRQTVPKTEKNACGTNSQQKHKINVDD